VNEKTKGTFGEEAYYDLTRSCYGVILVGENLFYKGVDKRTVHGARLHRPVHANESPVAGQKLPADKEQPPYPFKSGDNLLKLTREHNV